MGKISQRGMTHPRRNDQSSLRALKAINAKLQARNIKLEAENTSLNNRVAEFKKLERQRLKNIGPSRINFTFSPKTWAADNARLQKRISELEAENASLKNRPPIRVEHVDYGKLLRKMSASSNRLRRGKAE